MNNFKTRGNLLAIAVSMLFSLSIEASGVVNGNFQTGDFTGWSLATDGVAGTAPDFQIENLAGDYSARIEADYWSIPGDSLSNPQDNVWFDNTLYQEMNLTTSVNQNLVLSFEWVFAGEESIFDENFLVALGNGSGDYFGADGNLGFLFNPMDYGEGLYSVVLDPSFANATGWTIEFQMVAGFDAYGSYASIDNVALNAVPIPNAIILMATGIAGLLGLRRKIN